MATALAVAGAGLIVSCGSSAPATPQEKHYPPQVALFGDSLSWEAQSYYTSLVDATGETALTYDSHGGTAICDWLSRMQEVEAQYHPTVVDIQFSGNALTPCMQGYQPSTPAYYEKYRADTQAALDIFVPSGAHVYLVGAPITQSAGPGWERLNKQYADAAQSDPQHVSYVDAGTAVEGPGHTFTKTLSCLPVEPCLGPSVDGVPSNTVRSPDGVHFCPEENGDESGVIGGCPVYSSGAYRYADAMVIAMSTPVTAP
jgi:hypothetical protein